MQKLQNLRKNVFGGMILRDKGYLQFLRENYAHVLYPDLHTRRCNYISVTIP